MKSTSQKQKEFQTGFEQSQRTHIVMVTNHGMHNWNIVPGLPDTGGQNVFVNQLSQALADSGCRVTVFNRGGYPHPTTGDFREGILYRDKHQRLVFLTDNTPNFIPKEQMAPHIPELAQSLIRFLSSDPAPTNLFISHYWDGAEIGRLCACALNPTPLHIWIPHSLGFIKKQNVSPEQWDKLAIDQRISIEQTLCTEVDAIVSTSSLIMESLKNQYKYRKPVLDLPPCIDTDRFYPRKIHPENPIWTYISQHCDLSPSQLQSKKIITEISRTDSTKRKDVLIKAFLKLNKDFPDTLLLTSIDPDEAVGRELMHLINSADNKKNIAVFSNVYNQLPDLYAVSSLYCTPSIMEGFGMSAQEAAATGIPIVASNRVPFAVEFLMGNRIDKRKLDGKNESLLIGEGAVIVPADDAEGLAEAMAILLDNEQLRLSMGRAAYRLTIPAFSWKDRIKGFLQQIKNLDSNQAVCGKPDQP
ncbi:MAG: glycosyltransferase [Anaerolineales bacterium]|nr:glycosyltransferase [Anaerolineales bacterium]